MMLRKTSYKSDFAAERGGNLAQIIKLGRRVARGRESGSVRRVLRIFITRREADVSPRAREICPLEQERRPAN